MNVIETTITPLTAEKLLASNHANRPLSKSVVEKYVKEMKSGTWVLNGDSIRVDKNDCLLDGQHRLTACIVSGVPFSTLLITGIEPSVFTTIDIGKNRNASDTLALKGYTNTQSLATVIKFLMTFQHTKKVSTFDGGRATSNQSVLDFIEENPDVYVDTVEFRNRYTAAIKFTGVSAGGALFHIIKKKSPELAHFMFKSISTGAGLGEDSVILKYRNKMLSNTIEGKSMRCGYKALLLIRLWNKLKTTGDKGLLRWNNEETFPKIM